MRVALGLLLGLPVLAIVVWSVLADAALLIDELGLLGLALFLVVPSLVALHAWRQR